jgi:hypothetical protein
MGAPKGQTETLFADQTPLPFSYDIRLTYNAAALRCMGHQNPANGVVAGPLAVWIGGCYTVNDDRLGQ